MATITIGAAATDREVTSVLTYTFIVNDNPANGTGTITLVKLRLAIAATGVEVATFAGTNPFTTRDTQFLGDLDAVYHEIEVDLDVVEGDRIGIHATGGYIERDNSGGQGYYYKNGDYIPCTDETFDFIDSRIMSLGGTGVTVGGWAGSIFIGSEEIADPASVMGIAAANIQTVKGVASS